MLICTRSTHLCFGFSASTQNYSSQIKRSVGTLKHKNVIECDTYRGKEYRTYIQEVSIYCIVFITAIVVLD